MDKRLIDAIADEWCSRKQGTGRSGIFSLIRDGSFDTVGWTVMMDTLRSIPSALSSDEVAQLAKCLWLVPVLMITKMKYMEERGFDGQYIGQCRGQLEHEMSRLIGLP